MNHTLDRHKDTTGFFSHEYRFGNAVYWYNARVKSWVVYLADADNMQVGDSLYTYRKQDAMSYAEHLHNQPKPEGYTYRYQ